MRDTVFVILLVIQFAAFTVGLVRFGQRDNSAPFLVLAAVLGVIIQFL